MPPLKLQKVMLPLKNEHARTSKSVCFFKNTVDANGNKVAQEVVFDEAKAIFVNYTPAEASTNSNTGKSCGSKKGKCCSKGSASTLVRQNHLVQLINRLKIILKEAFRMRAFFIT
jgi:hypothetical protein